MIKYFCHPWQFTTLAQAPEQALIHGKGTDIEGSLPVLWSLVLLTKPRLVVELGTRQATSTKTLALACEKIGSRLITIDPDRSCERYVKNLPNTEWICDTGETAFDLMPDLKPDMMHIDTDPHTFKQTFHWLNTWVTERLSPGGVAAFHDIYPARPEIQVTNAVEEWLITRKDWIWWKLATDQYGLGLLWAPDESF